MFFRNGYHCWFPFPVPPYCLLLQATKWLMKIVWYVITWSRCFPDSLKGGWPTHIYIFITVLFIQYYGDPEGAKALYGQFSKNVYVDGFNGVDLSYKWYINNIYFFSLFNVSQEKIKSWYLCFRKKLTIFKKRLQRVYDKYCYVWYDSTLSGVPELIKISNLISDCQSCRVTILQPIWA